MSFASLSRPLHFSRQNPRNPSTNPSAFAMMKSGIYVPPIPRLRSVIASANGTIHTAATSVDYDWRDNGLSHFNKQQSASYGRFAYDDFSEDDSDRDGEASSVASSKGASMLDNVDEWKWKLSLLLRNEREQEVISRERKDRRDYEQLAALAERMGLYSCQYAKVVVFGKVPLPNYRSDIDDKRPQREVSIPVGLQREVDALLGDYLSRKHTNRESFPNLPFSWSNSIDGFAADEGLFEQQDTQAPTSVVMEKILRRRSFQLRNQQQSWQELPEGQRMLEFRRSLPSYKEKEALLEAISRNQRLVFDKP